MRRLPAALAGLTAALALCGPAGALEVGVTDDEGTVNAGPVYSALQDLGMRTNVVSVRWDPRDPFALPPNLPDVRTAAEAAAARGIGIILATHQSVNTGIGGLPAGPALYAEWLRRLALECPLCARRVIVLNEPNLQFFFRPTFDELCQPSAPAVYAQVLAAAYDALKGVDPAIRVYGVGLSPRGNDNCRAVSNVSLSPVSFLAALGKAYRAMGRDRPLMDALSFHPYPDKNHQGPTVGYRWPNAGVPNLDRLKQAFHDAFGGTAQPPIGVGSVLQQTTIALDELGWQVDTTGLSGYRGEENVPTVPEVQQAEWYTETVARFACDSSVETLNFFLLRDEPDRARWQSGLLRVDGSRRASYDAVKQAIAQNADCQGVPVTWRPATRVTGARALWPAKKNYARKRLVYSFRVAVQEKATYRAQIVRIAGPPKAKGAPKKKAKKAPAKQRPVVVKRSTGHLRANMASHVPFAGKLKPGKYRFEITVAALTNPARTSVFKSRAFTVK